MDTARKKQRKIKRFKRKRVWQTVVAMVCMLVGVTLLFALYSGASQQLMTVPYVEQGCKDMDLLVQLLESEISDGTDFAQLLRESGAVNVGQVYIYDRAGNALYRGGELTPPEQKDDMNISYKLLLGDVVKDYQIYQTDLSADMVQAFLETDSLYEDTAESGSPLRAYLDKKDMAMFGMWIMAPVADGEYTVYLEQKAMMDYQDKLQLALTILFTICMFLFPFLNFLISSIRSIVSQNRLARLYYLDAVTMGKNWMYFKERAGKLMRRRNKNKDRYAVVCLHMDKYRSYCTCYGNTEGERLLERMYNILKSQMQTKETFARYSDAEFGLLLRDIPGESFEQRLYSLMSLLSGAAEGRTIHFGIGVCVVTDWSSDPEECFVCASMARATLSADSPQPIVWFNDQMKQERVWERHVEDTMYQALESGEFQVYVQPKYDPVTETLTGGEALIRWISPQDGFIGPGKFIPIFEKNSFITRIDDFMVSQVAKLQAEWIAAGKQVVPISVNLSRAHFADPTLPEHICALVDAYNVPHHLIELEITESVFFDDKAALLSAIDRLHGMGFEISMDDFGSGYSSLNSLKDLSLDVLKLDGEFFRGKQEEGRGDIVVEEAIKLAKRLNMRIVAEGVEHKEQVDFLADKGCDMIQGFYFAKPMPSAEFAERLGAGAA